VSAVCVHPVHDLRLTANAEQSRGIFVIVYPQQSQCQALGVDFGEF
jgi:hypothetical protein